MALENSDTVANVCPVCQHAEDRVHWVICPGCGEEWEGPLLIQRVAGDDVEVQHRVYHSLRHFLDHRRATGAWDWPKAKKGRAKK